MSSNLDETRESILKKLKSSNFIKKKQAFDSIYKLPGSEPLQIIEHVLKLDGNVGMKLDALRIIPILVNPSEYYYISKILHSALRIDDPEIIRKTFLCIRNIPIEIADVRLIHTIIEKLQYNDTDVQYQAILTLDYLRSKIEPTLFESTLEFFRGHPNSALKKAALNALNKAN